MDTSEEVFTQFSAQLWKELPILTIIQFCKTNKQFAEICSQKETWQYLLERDFGINKKSDDPRKKYVKILLRKRAKRLIDQAQRITQLNQDLQICFNRISLFETALSLLGYNPQDKNVDFYGNKVGVSAVNKLVRGGIAMSRAGGTGHISALEYLIINTQNI